MTILLRPATAEDAAAMAALEAGAASHPWSEVQYADSIASHHCWVLEEGGQLVGLLVYSQVLDEMELLNVAVATHSQGRGFGRRLLDCLLAQGRDRAARIFLEVRESNQAALHLYRRAGFVESGLRKHYYPAPAGREHAVLMTYDYQ